jgi:hypothetical protein
VIPDDIVTDEGELVHLALYAEVEPVHFREALKDQNCVAAMQEELGAIQKNETWELCQLPPGKKPITLKWVYKLKKKADGSIARFKARLVPRGFLQQEGVDFHEVYAPVARMETIRTMVALVSMNGWGIHQMDVKSAFLNGLLEEEVYVTQPPGFEKQDCRDKVLRLRKALYGLKQAPRAWNKRIDKFLLRQGFRK